MNPQLFQSIKLMALPVVDLRERIQEEIERNPALEVLEDRTTVSLDDYTPRREEDDYFESTSDSGFSRKGGGDEDSDEQRKFIEGVLTRPETLQDHLLWQLRLQPLDPDRFKVAELLIQNLNADGFYIEPLDVFFKDGAPPCLGEMLELVRSLEPPGTCVSDYRESLLVQARLLPDSLAGIEELVSVHLELLERGKIAEIAKRMKLSEDRVRELLERVKELTPFPGRQFDTSDTRFVVPDLQVVRKEGDFVIILNEEEIPVLGINPFFMKLSDGKDGEKPVRDFVKENIKEARWFIRSINQRNHTLLRVARALVEFQRNFFVDGPKHLAPLTLKDIAQEIGVHETTVSRIANGKYIQTEWGIFEIRHFFTNSISGAGSGGSRYSKEGVKEIIREIIAEEGRKFSDQELADLLGRRGIPLARRTVAKYRKELSLGSSYDR
jgi:RNA polymerase sigma-54 factor